MSKSQISSMSGLIQARPMLSALKSAKICAGRLMFIAKALTSIAAGSSHHCLNRVARVGEHPMTMW